MSRTTLLIIEDEKQVRQVLAEILADYQLIEAATSQEVLAQIDTFRPDLILLDLTLPDSEISGIELCAYLKAVFGVPVLILSGSDIISNVSEALAIGADWFISKPYSPHMLLDMIERLLKRQMGGD